MNSSTKELTTVELEEIALALTTLRALAEASGQCVPHWRRLESRLRVLAGWERLGAAA